MERTLIIFAYEICFKKYHRINIKMLSFFEYIKNNTYETNFNIDLFINVWYPLSKHRELLITNDIIYFIFNKTNDYSDTSIYNNLKHFKKVIKKNLKKYHIEYKKVTYNTIKCNKLFMKNVEKDIKQLNEADLYKKTWILISVKNLKNLIIKMDTLISKNVINYFLILEQLIFDYLQYTLDKNGVMIERH